MPDSERRSSEDNCFNEEALPVPIQVFLWRQISPFVKPKLGKLHEASCMFCQHSMTGHHELKEACKMFERVLVQNIQSGLKTDLSEAIRCIPRWRLIQASLPHVMHSTASLLFNRMKDGNIQSLGAVETKLMYTLHWILLDAAEECADNDFEKGLFHSSPFFYLFSIPTMTLFVYLFAPMCHHLKESDFQNFRLENGLKIWQAMWEFRHPEALCFTSHCKPKPKYLLGKNVKHKTQFGDVFLGLIKIEDLAMLSSEINIYHCTAYIIVTKDVSKVGNIILEDVKNEGIILPHERILIFCDCDDVVNESFSEIVNVYGIDIILVKYKPMNEEGVLLSTGIKTISVKSQFKDKILATWNHSFTDTVIDTTELEQPEWFPKNEPKHSSPFTVATFNCTPFFYVNEKNHIIGGIEYQLINEIIHRWKHQYLLIESEDKYQKWGLAVDAVINKSADIATCSQWQISQNLSRLDTTYPLRQICATFLVPKARLLPHFTFIWQPFTLMLWLLTTFIIVLMTIFIGLVSEMYENFQKDNFSSVLDSDKTTTLLYLIRLWTNGGVEFIPHSSRFSLRLLFSVWYLACVLFTTYYSAGVTSSLTHPRFTYAVRTIQDMVNHKVVWWEEPYLKESFKKSHNTLFNQLADLTVPSKGQNVAIITKQLSSMYLTDTEDLDLYDQTHLTVLKECFGDFYIVFPIRKRSPYKKIIDKYNAWFQEQGLVQFWLKNITYFDNAQNHFSSLYSLFSDDQLHQHYIDMRRFVGAVYLLLAGNLGAFLVFLCEYFHLLSWFGGNK
ncbi:hypothetical protein Zmor_001108 [Zophobas morio]|uniref:Ionotropic glutamate receptor C-terminal domain-containing protein n=1 Tax=Zophobas morio TaxID=2755281 RepID=A0AA38MS21_9CUCU|nr:hypothetical protein Zmor_001108 [Zophobas morio]